MNELDEMRKEHEKKKGEGGGERQQTRGDGNNICTGA
jgi:hypothetical protein